MDRLRALPGVDGVGIVNNIPLDEGTGSGRFLTDAMNADGGGTLLSQNFAGGDYFRIMGVDLLRLSGRAAVARPRSDRTAAPSRERSGAVVHGGRPGAGREAKRLAERGRGRRLLSDDRTHRARVVAGIAGVRRQVAAGGEPGQRSP